MAKEPKSKKIGFVSLGCQKNLVDTEVMLGIISQAGYKLVSEQFADTMIINTCCFIKEAQEESDQTILEFCDLKKRGKLRKLIVTGCLPQRHREKLKEMYPEVDHFLGSSDFPAIARFLKDSPERLFVNTPEYIYSSESPRIITGPNHSAYVKIAEGCSERCTFCIIPKLRGRFRSRTIADIFNEVSRLAEGETKEINLLAQNLTGYGKDLKDGSSLTKLLEKLCGINELRWIRLIYNYPRDFSDDLIDMMASEDKICNYVDLPLQHIDDDILKAMGRYTTRREITVLLDKLKARLPGVVLRSSFIVGFPGETEDKFKKMIDFIRQYEFDKIAIFPYSHEKGTVAYELENTVSDDERLLRYDELDRIKKEISLRKNSAFAGKKIEVVSDSCEKEKDSYIVQSRFYGQAPEVDGFVWVRSKRNIWPGEFFNAMIEKADEYDLYGTEKR